jgi:nitrate reductase NapAB chaperone NapD
LIQKYKDKTSVDGYITINDKFQKSDFIKPDILEISGVEVYKDDGKLKLVKEKRDMEKKEKELELLKQTKGSTG